jgi:hypothetical protein
MGSVRSSGEGDHEGRPYATVVRANSSCNARKVTCNARKVTCNARKVTCNARKGVTFDLSRARITSTRFVRGAPFVAALEIPGSFCQHELFVQALEVRDAFQEPFGLVARDRLDGPAAMLEQNRAVFECPVREWVGFEFAVLVDSGHVQSVGPSGRAVIRHLAHGGRAARRVHSRV